MKIKKIYFDDELECWENISIFFGLDVEKETENEFEDTKQLFWANNQKIYNADNIVLSILSNNNKILILLEDMQEEIVYTLEI